MRPKIQLAIFYCTHQADWISRVLKALDGSNPVHVRKVALPCSGKLEVFHLTQALEDGADGAALCGCPEEKCRYSVGSRRAEGRVRYTKKILEEIGLGGERVHRFILESHPGPENMEALSGWIEKIQAMGTLHGHQKISH
jgi:F420-non-reducing hydrogenase iron-sulfur subunit